jgi:hypothetical protein
VLLSAKRPESVDRATAKILYNVDGYSIAVHSYLRSSTSRHLECIIVFDFYFFDFSRLFGIASSELLTYNLATNTDRYVLVIVYR